ncbi:MAG TPA: T9SS type A sorting domain-containing protein, partial [Ignavibacteriaceae bacterium]
PPQSYHGIAPDMGFLESPYPSEVPIIFEQPNNYSLSQNYPNPFNPSTKISWQSPVGSWQTLKVYDVLGNEVATLVDEYKPAGEYEVEFNVAQISRPEISSGVYYYQIKTGSFIETKKMILLR